VTLADVLSEAAASLPVAVERSVAADGSVEWSAGGLVFATLDASGRTAAFRLDRVVAGAARLTPDTARSKQGDAWVEFRPGVLDGPAVDRARAWFIAAHRRTR
jgi:hypothetical protein